MRQRSQLQFVRILVEGSLRLLELHFGKIGLELRNIGQGLLMHVRLLLVGQINGSLLVLWRQLGCAAEFQGDQVFGSC